MYIDPLQGRVKSYELVREVRLHLETGSIVNPDTGRTTPQQMSFTLPPAGQPVDTVTLMRIAEEQRVRCAVVPNATDSPLCRLLNDPMPPREKWFCDPRTGAPMEPDLDRVCIYNIQSNNVWCSLPIEAAVRVGFTHRGLDALYHLERTKKLFADAGTVEGAYMNTRTTPPDGMDIQEEPLPRAANYANAFFTATMANVTEGNMFNCIVDIPGQVCGAAGLPGFSGPPEPEPSLIAAVLTQRGKTIDDREAYDEFCQEWLRKWEAQQQGKPRITHYHAVPVNHVLAWGLRDAVYAEQHGVRAHHFGYKPTPGNSAGLDPKRPVLLYFLVDNITMTRVADSFKRAWLGKVDERPLSSLHWDFVPHLDRARYPNLPADATVAQGVARIRHAITYMVSPKMTPAQIASVAPVLDPHFPPCTNWLPADPYLQQQMQEEAAKQD